MTTTKETPVTSEQILSEAGLDPALVRRMTTYQQLTAVPCPVCKAGAGRACINLPDARVVHDGRAPFVADMYGPMTDDDRVGDVCPSCGADTDEPVELAICPACGADNTDD